MKGVNKAIIVGTLGKDPETRYMPSGSAVSQFSIATNESWTDKQTGQKQERTEWHNITMFGRLAEVAGEYLKKGSQVYIEGKLQTDKWQDKQGNDRYTTKIIANEMQMLGGKPEGQRDNTQTNVNDPAQHASGNRNQPNPTYAADDGFDDDIPF